MGHSEEILPFAGNGAKDDADLEADHKSYCIIYGYK